MCLRLISAIVCLLLWTSIACADKRIALVIGNSTYAHFDPLKNPARDAAAVAKALREAGFQTVKIEDDLGHDAMLAALRRFQTEADQADWALVYYAGHGVEVGGVNYLIPVDAHMVSDRDVDEEAVSLAQVQKRLEGARKLRIVILDACRENPFGARMARSGTLSRSIGRGLAVPELPQSGSLVAFSADVGQLALDGETSSGNSPYATALVKALAVPDLEVNIFFRRVRAEVLRTTNNRQWPATYEMLQEDLYVINPATRTPERSGSKIAALPVAPLPVDATKVDSCDRLAASSFDEERPAKVPAVSFADIKPTEAIEACSEALKIATPTIVKRRLHFELGRALQAAGRPAEAAAAYASADAAGSGIAAVSLWRLYSGGFGIKRDDVAALAYISNAADRGYAPAMSMMGFFYESGSHGVKKDVGTARTFWLKAAGLGNASAMVGLGVQSFKGEGVDQDPSAGQAWLDRGEAKNDLAAMPLIGEIYAQGKGVPADFAKAKMLFEAAAAGGSGLGMMDLGDLYAKGLGVPRDASVARSWYEKAFANGNMTAKRRLDDLGTAASGTK